MLMTRIRYSPGQHKIVQGFVVSDFSAFVESRKKQKTEDLAQNWFFYTERRIIQSLFLILHLLVDFT